MPTRHGDDDASDRTAAREEIQLLHEALQAAGNAIVITDLDGRIEWANPAFTAMTGYSLPEAVGHTFGELIQSGEHDDAFYRNLWETITRGDVWEGRIVNRRKDGSLYPEYQTITPVRDSSGEIAHFIAVKRDDTDRVRRERELRRANRALRVISGGNQALVRTSDEQELLDEVCRVAVEAGGYPFAWIGFVSDDDPERIRAAAHRGDGGAYLERADLSLGDPEIGGGPVGRAVRTGEVAVVRALDDEGGGAPWEREAAALGYRSKIAVPLVDGGRTFGALSIYANDPRAFDEREVEVLAELGEDLAHGISMHRVRRRKAELEDQLQQAEKLRAVGQLAGGVAHDFNNFLTVITTLTDLVLDDPSLSEEARAELREVREAADSSSRLTRQLLAFSRQQVAALEVVDLNDQVRRMVSMLDRILEESIRVRLRLAEEPLPVRVDPGQLEQVMMNLSVNARDAMPEGGTLTIATERRSESRHEELPGDRPDADSWVVLTVADTGTGIDEDDLPRIFEPFFTDKDDGTGLGLSTVYGIVKQFGGAIRVDSERGRGTRFEIVLPAQEDAEPDATAAGEAEAETVEGSERVLVVEDEASVRRAVRRVLERSGYRIAGCGSVGEAVELRDDPEVSVDLLVTDLGLPDGSGREVARAFREAYPELPVVFMSGYTRDESDYALELGDDQRFIQKPFDHGDLVRLVRSALDGRNGG